MRIGFEARVLATPETRGLVRYTVGLLRALSQFEDIELVLFSREPLWADHLIGVQAKVVTFGARRETLWYDWALPRMIRREAIDVFHAPADRGLPAAKPCPLVVTVHESYERSRWRTLFRTTRQRLWYWKFELVNYLFADAVLTVSDTTRNALIGLRVAPARKIRRVHLAPSSEFVQTATEDDDRVREKYGISQPFVLCVGGYDERKNVGRLVEAFSTASLQKHELVVVGVHRYGYQQLVSRWQGHSGFNRLRLLEVDSVDIPALYRQADIFVQPSAWESFSFPLVEAMACGTPALVSDCMALPEIAGGAALHFDPEDVVGLARLMERVVSDPALKAELRMRGLARAREFSWHRVAAETAEVYREVLRGRPAAQSQGRRGVSCVQSVSGSTRQPLKDEVQLLGETNDTGDDALAATNRSGANRDGIPAGGERMMTMAGPPDFSNYWRRIKLREQAMAIPAPCVTWQRTPHFNEVESLIWERVKEAARILDFGSGDQSLRKKFLAAGYAGRYETFDVSPEFPTTWTDPDQIDGKFNAVICLEVIEYVPLAEGLALRQRLLSWLAPEGWLILSTPNPACIISPFARDESHVHLYPLHDLLTWALAEGLMPQAWRVKQIPERLTSVIRLRLFVQRILCYLIGADRADGLLLVARRPRGEETQQCGSGSSPTT